MFQIKNSLGPTDLRSFESNTVQPESDTLSRITRRTITENSSPSRLKTKHGKSYSNRKGKLIMGSTEGFRVTMLIRTHSIVLKIKLSIQTRQEHMCFFHLWMTTCYEPLSLVQFRIERQQTLIHMLKHGKNKSPLPLTYHSFLSPWHISGSSSLQLFHICSCLSYTCEQSLAPKDHLDLGPSTANKLKAKPNR